MGASGSGTGSQSFGNIVLSFAKDAGGGDADVGRGGDDVAPAGRTSARPSAAGPPAVAGTSDVDAEASDGDTSFMSVLGLGSVANGVLAMGEDLSSSGTSKSDARRFAAGVVAGAGVRGSGALGSGVGDPRDGAANSDDRPLPASMGAGFSGGTPSVGPMVWYVVESSSSSPEATKRSAPAKNTQEKVDYSNVLPSNGCRSGRIEREG
jgi:hypothetical protein